MKKLKEFFFYHQWAYGKIMNHLCDLPEGVYQQPIQNVFPSIAATIRHLYDVDLLWFKRIADREEEQEPLLETAADMQKCLALLHQEIADYLEEQSDFTQMVTYTNSAGEEFSNTVEELIIHLVNHGTYHRGNITSMLWSLGQKSVSTDYIYYLRTHLDSE